jgi:excisionase family DNA binding protein
MARSNDDDVAAVTFSVRQVAQFLGISESSARRRIRDGSLPAIELGGRVLVLRQSVVDNIAKAVNDPRAATILADEAEIAAERADESRRHDAAVRVETERDARLRTEAAARMRGEFHVLSPEDEARMGDSARPAETTFIRRV